MEDSDKFDIASTIGLVVALAGLQIEPDSSILGLKFRGLSDFVVRAVLAAVISYLLFHFLWTAWDSFLEWRLRITGTRSAFQTGSFFAPEHVDFPIDPRQSTLYNWWAMQQSNIENIGALVEDITTKTSRWETDLEKLRNARAHAPDWDNLGNVIRGLAEVRELTAKLSRSIEANTKAITDPRIPTSLRRFDNWFELFLRSQNLRWFVVEFAAPVIFAFLALYVLILDIAVAGH